MKALILAGGFATRLAPVSKSKPKPMFEINGKPILEYLVLFCREHNFKEIVISSYFQADKIVDYFGDGYKFGVSINYSLEKGWPLGTAGSIKRAEKLLRGDSFLVLNGDVLTDVNLTEMYNFHKQKGGLGTLFVHPTDHPLDSDLVEFDENYLVKRFYRPVLGGTFEPVAKSGSHFFQDKVLDMIPSNQAYSLEKDLIPILLSRGEKLYAYYSQAYSKDMGTWDRLFQVRGDVESGLVKISITQ